MSGEWTRGRRMELNSVCREELLLHGVGRRIAGVANGQR
jgi:hypothetical protein